MGNNGDGKWKHFNSATLQLATWLNEQNHSEIKSVLSQSLSYLIKRPNHSEIANKSVAYLATTRKCS